MCKFILSTVFILFVSFTCFGQPDTSGFSKADARARSIKYNGDVKKLTSSLVAPFNTELLKTRVIFKWITENITYDVKEYHQLKNGFYAALKQKLAKEPAATFDKKYNAEIVKYVLQSKSAICDGYARLFKIMCDECGLISETILGDAKNSFDDIGKGLDTNHAWNAVLINSKWYLLDATWASGFSDSKGMKFTKEFDESYFLIQPEKMALNHFPINKNWFLCESPPTFEKFSNFPYVQSNFFKWNISSFSPENGIIHAKTGDTLTFTFSIPDLTLKVDVFEKKSDKYFKKVKSESATVYRYAYIVPEHKTEEINIKLESDIILTYRLISDK